MVGHCARLLRLPDFPSGHIVVSSFACSLSDLRLTRVTASMAQVKNNNQSIIHQARGGIDGGGGIDSQRSQFDETERVPVRVARLQQGRTHCGNCARKKQVIGEDSDLEESGRILNRVIERDRDGITIEADQRHVREI